jgi:outer membrane protein assembly factor BamB
VTPLWEVESAGTVIDGMLAGPGGVVYAVEEGSIRALAPRDGHLLWEAGFDSDLHLPPTGLGGRLYQIAGTRLVALSTVDGEKLWTTTLPAAITASPTPVGPIVAAATSERALVAYHAEDGAFRWRVELECQPTAPVGTGADLLVLGCDDGHLLGVDFREGRILWRRKTGGRIRTRPVVYEGRAYVGNDAGEIIAVGLRRGRRKYTSRVAADPVAPLALRRKLLLVGAMDNLLYAFRLKNGHLAWSADAGTRNLSAPALRNDLAACAPPLSPRLVILDTRDGAVLARSRFPPEDRLAASAPVFAGSVLVNSTRTLAGGPGWITGYSVTVEELTATGAGQAPATAGSPGGS